MHVRSLFFGRNWNQDFLLCHVNVHESTLLGKTEYINMCLFCLSFLNLSLFCCNLWVFLFSKLFHVRPVTQGDVYRADAKDIPRIFQVRLVWWCFCASLVYAGWNEVVLCDCSILSAGWEMFKNNKKKEKRKIKSRTTRTPSGLGVAASWVGWVRQHAACARMCMRWFSGTVVCLAWVENC